MKQNYIYTYFVVRVISLLLILSADMGAKHESMGRNIMRQWQVQQDLAYVVPARKCTEKKSREDWRQRVYARKQLSDRIYTKRVEDRNRRKEQRRQKRQATVCQVLHEQIKRDCCFSTLDTTQ